VAAAAAATKEAEEKAAAKKTVEIDGLAAAVARANLGPDVLARAAAWLAAEGASSVTQLEADDIDGALCGRAHASAHSGRGLVERLGSPPRLAQAVWRLLVGWFVCVTRSATAFVFGFFGGFLCLFWPSAFALRRMAALDGVQSSWAASSCPSSPRETSSARSSRRRAYEPCSDHRESFLTAVPQTSVQHS
jgi:hypothetical protein